MNFDDGAASPESRALADAAAAEIIRREQAHAAALHEREALERSLRELQERYDVLLADRAFVIERVSGILERLRP